MADVGTKGLDLYILDGKQWKFVGSGRPGTEQTRTSTMIANMEPKEREYMVYLSLYDGVQSLEIGIDEDATIQAPGIESPKADSPVVMYGSSILQGGCCSRPGMAFTNILSRRFDREVINLGFSGNALLDYDIAELIAKVENPSLFVLDYVPNASAEQIREKGEKFFRIIRDAHPDVPVIFIDDPFYAHYGSDMKMTAEIDGKNEAQAELVAKLKKQGEKNIQYIQLQHTLGTDNEPFVDGVHYTDLGMMRYADFLTPYFKRALK